MKGLCAMLKLKQLFWLILFGTHENIRHVTEGALITNFKLYLFLVRLFLFARTTKGKQHSQHFSVLLMRTTWAARDKVCSSLYL